MAESAARLLTWPMRNSLFFVHSSVEKCRQMVIPDAFGVRLVAVGNAVQKWQDLIGRNLSKLSISKILTESTDD
jgi:hypothetical protein